MPNFADALDRTVDSIEPPAKLPPGNYIFVVEKAPEIRNIDNESWEFYDFSLNCVGPADDATAAALQDEGFGDPAGVRRRHTFIFPKGDDADAMRNFEGTLFRLRTFYLDHLQVPGNDETSLKQLAAESVGARCMCSIEWQQDKQNAEIIRDQIGRTAPEA